MLCCDAISHKLFLYTLDGQVTKTMSLSSHHEIDFSGLRKKRVNLYVILYLAIYPICLNLLLLYDYTTSNYPIV